MRDGRDLRIIREAEYIVENNATLRACAAVFGVGKSTVHTDVTKKLKNIDGALFEGEHAGLAAADVKVVR